MPGNASSSRSVAWPAWTRDAPCCSSSSLYIGTADGIVLALRRRCRKLRADSQQRVDVLIARSRQGNLLRDGLDVVLVGAPNVGKSSLLNRLAGDELAIVTPIPGTTRDAIRSDIDVRGVPLRVVDTAGVREAGDEVEAMGIARTWAALARADLALIVTDARDTDDAHAALLEKLAPSLARLLVRKVDLLDAPARRTGDHGDEIWLSALTGEGIELLQDAVLDAAGAQPSMEGAFIARERHIQALLTAQRHLASAHAHLHKAQPPLELFAEDLRLAHDALASIAGKFSSDDLLGEIFSRFCIGK